MGYNSGMIRRGPDSWVEEAARRRQSESRLGHGDLVNRKGILNAKDRVWGPKQLRR